MTIRVVELFAGVGGFRLGLERCSRKFETVWANQWEPGKKSQHAFDCYVFHFGKNENHVNKDIAEVKQLVPEHDLLVGGFPCQDYSVARTQAKGIEGKKGVLWWEIVDIVNNRRPKYILLENVDRLLKSPSHQRGRDFGIIIRTLVDMDYAVEWRTINAADYGFAQRRRRVFIFGFHKSTKFFSKLLNSSVEDWLRGDGFFQAKFPVKPFNQVRIIDFGLENYKDLVDMSQNFTTRFCNTGVAYDYSAYTVEALPLGCKPMTIGQIMQKDAVEDKYFINGNLDKWKYLKGAKREPRVKPNGEPYFYTEGGISFPDALDKPARTILTSESSVNRSTHVIKDAVTGRLRLLTPVECERLNGFPDDWTNTGMPEKFRYFVMGNALVVPLIEKMGERICEVF